jgi:hypothetical protein
LPWIPPEARENGDEVRLAREQLTRSAIQSGAIEHANRSARELLRTLFPPPAE